MAIPFNELKEALAEQYELEREIGQGGMGTVYLARDRRHDRPVAIKVLRPDVAESVGSDRFLREVRLAARMSHPRIVPVYDSGEKGGYLFYVMPYLPGETLGDLLRREGELKVGPALGILTQIADALSYAHSKGVIHRDLKPDNVLLNGCHALLTDFGVAKGLCGPDADEKATLVGSLVGTPAYMAPEQVEARGEIGCAADIYSFGVVAYELLTGTPPFSGGGAGSVLTAKLLDSPTPILERRSDLSPDLAGAIERCLERDPSDRWATISEMAAALEAALQSCSGVTIGRSPVRRTPVLQSARISESTCRKLDLENLDPRVIGAKLQYLDNHADSPDVAIYLHGLGLDHREFERVLEVSQFRGVAPTQAGFEPAARHRFELSLADHGTILADFIADLAIRLQPRSLILVGFSSGADLGFHILRNHPLPATAFLSLDCNLSLETCFVSRLLPGLDLESDTMEELERLGAAVSGLSEWLNVHEYLIKVFRKFEGQAGPLRRFAADVVAPFEADGHDVFPSWYRAASESVPFVKCLFSRSSGYVDAVRALQLANLESGILGEHYREESISLEDENDHFDLLRPDRLDTQIEALVRS